MGWDMQHNPWSDNPNAPKIPYHLYFDEKANFAGSLVTSILYGFLVVLFFKCMAALLDPVDHRGEPIKWGLVSYTVVMFSVATVQTAVNLQIQSISYIDNREFPGIVGEISPGPIGYQVFMGHEALTTLSNVMFFLNAWLADGFLLYRCWVIFSMTLWVIAFPCLMYLASLAMGSMFIYQGAVTSTTDWSAIPYYSITLSLNVILTLMIVVRLVLHTRNTRAALGITGIGGLCNAVITMLIESCALYAAGLLPVIGSWAARNPITNFFLLVSPQTQVIAPLLIIQRVANKSALTSQTVAPGRVSEFKAKTLAESTGGGEDCTSSVDTRGVTSCEFVVGVETTVDFRRDKI